MKRLTGLLCGALFITCLMPAAAQEDPAPLPEDVRANAEALRDRAMEGTGAYDLVASLTTEVGARLAGTPGDRAAVAWALLKLRELGFEDVRAEKVTVPRWVRGEIEARVLEPFPQPLVALALGGSIGTDDEGIEAPVIMAEDLEALKAMEREDVQGKIVYIGDEMVRRQDGSGYGEAVQKRVNGPSAAARLGARALVIRSVGTSRSRVAHTGITRYAEDVDRIPAVAVSNADADMIERQLATGHDVILHLKLTSRTLADAESANVIGEIPGTDAPESGIVLLAGHLDSWDVGTGAVDDGAGVAIAMEAARLIGAMDEPPRRTVRVVLFANEEFGLSGARAYAKEHADALDRHVLAMEADFGAGRVWRLDSNVPEDRLDVVSAMHALLEPLDVERGNNDSGGGADIGVLKERGVPVLGPRQDGTVYFDWHHSPNDTLDKINREDLDQNVAVYATLAYVAGMLEDDLGRLTNGKDAEEEGDEDEEMEDEEGEEKKDEEKTDEG